MNRSSSAGAADATANPYASANARYYAVGILTVVYTFNFIDRQLLAILQESIKVDLSLSDTQLDVLSALAADAARYIREKRDEERGTEQPDSPESELEANV